MRRSQFWTSLLILLVAVSACGLERETSDTPEPAATRTPEPGPPIPTISGPATPGTATPEPNSPGFALPEVNLPDIDVPAGALSTAQAALGQAGDAAGTAVIQAGTAVVQAGTVVVQAGTAVQRAGDAASTAAVAAPEQGEAALATIQAIDTPDLSELRQRLAAARPDEDGNLSITLNESELNQILRLRYLVMSAEPELTDATVRFESGVIVLSGNVPLPLPVGVTLSLRPVVADGRFEFEIVDASLGRVQAPELILAFAGNLVSSAVTEIIGRLPEGFQLQSITVDEGQLTISGRISN